MKELQRESCWSDEMTTYSMGKGYEKGMWNGEEKERTTKREGRGRIGYGLSCVTMDRITFGSLFSSLKSK